MPRKKQPKIDWDVYFKKWKADSSLMGFTLKKKTFFLSMRFPRIHISQYAFRDETTPITIDVSDARSFKWLEELDQTQAESLLKYIKARFETERLARRAKAQTIIEKKLAKAIIK